MWLIDVRSLHPKEFVGNAPTYAILSHTWGEDELTFQEMLEMKGRHKKGFSKIQMTCDQAIKDHIDWVWIDTCCIDKKSSAELSEAINSMFNWYENAAVCYTYLADVTIADFDSEQRLFKKCRWVTRGWTLQELLAPRDMVFYDCNWDIIGTKIDLTSALSRVTGIYSSYIDTTLPFSSATVAERMSWASKRKTTREEDSAYCLLGIFGVNMPLLYGEKGHRAFVRLQEEILSKRYDPTIFGFSLWDTQIERLPLSRLAAHIQTPTSLLASEASDFRIGHRLEINSRWPHLAENAPMVRNGTLHVTVPIVELTPPAIFRRGTIKEPPVLAFFGFRLCGWGHDTLGLILRRWGDDLYCRDGTGTLAVRIPTPDFEYLKSRTRTIRIREKPQWDPKTRMEILIDEKLIQFPFGAQLENFVVVLPTTYNMRTRLVSDISIREGPMFALIYSKPSGHRFGLIFNKVNLLDIMVRQVSLGRLASPNGNDAISAIKPPQVYQTSNQSHGPSEQQFLDHERADKVLEILKLSQYKLESYIRDLGGPPQPVPDEAYQYLVGTIALHIDKELGVRIYQDEISSRRPNAKVKTPFNPFSAELVDVNAGFRKLNALHCKTSAKPSDHKNLENGNQARFSVAALILPCIGRRRALAMKLFIATELLLAVAAPVQAAFTWQNVKIGGGGGFVPGFVFHPKTKGVAYARTDIGGLYRLNSDDSWTAVTDSIADNANWSKWGVDAVALDPQDANKVYAAVGSYTNSWDPNNGAIIRSSDKGATWSSTSLTFKVGGNMPGRGMGERLAVDPANSKIIYFGARSGNGLWKSTDGGVTFSKVSSFTAKGLFAPDPKDTNGYNNDPQGLAFVTFDSTSGTTNGATSRIFVGTADNTTSSVWVTENAGSTWSAVAGQPGTFFPHKCVLQPTEKALYLTYSDGTGPYDGTLGAVYRYDITAATWKNITPVSGGDLYFGFGGIGVDMLKPGTIVVASLNSWYPDAQLFRSTDSGTTWSRLWEWSSWPDMNKFYSQSTSKAPWIKAGFLDQDTKDLVITGYIPRASPSSVVMISPNGTQLTTLQFNLWQMASKNSPY
ncbi:hypothetical protein NUW58_g3269 [Xylaria curta]|uniref:Uncharacterized protein n=1 Tax=Xylaria curta TaxID=42375 RepID=A0ACC1PEF1_9PEZI|nr:hypothetical protein NUW58_g3269 [Xylaria curta]